MSRFLSIRLCVYVWFVRMRPLEGSEKVFLRILGIEFATNERSQRTVQRLSQRRQHLGSVSSVAGTDQRLLGIAGRVAFR